LNVKLLPIALVMLLSGCLTSADQMPEAEALVQTLHQGMSQQDWDAIMPLYGKDFFKSRTPDMWRETLAKQAEVYGQLRNIKPTFRQKDPRFRGDFYIFGYLLKFEHGTVRETVTVYQGVDKDHMEITGHLLKPKGKNT